MEVYERIKRDLFWLVMLALVMQIIYASLFIGRDSTDGERRSGMSLHVDAMTGCHYLASQYGGMTPRLDERGRHVCTGEE